MEWRDTGFVIHLRKHGENSAIVGLLTQEQGRAVGLVRGASGKRVRGLLQTGHQVSAHWRARLSEHLGSLSLESKRPVGFALYQDGDRLAGLTAAAALTELALPEREPHPVVYDAFAALLEMLEQSEFWPFAYVRFELGLLAELGFGLDLSGCAVTGSTRELIYVSPKSGRAVSADAGHPYRYKLLPLPKFLLGEGRGQTDIDTANQIQQGLALTGFFLERVLAESHPQGGLPPARERLLSRLQKASTIRGSS